MRIDTYNNAYRKYVNYIKKYRGSSNAATASEVDSNANVESKNIATCDGELCKREKIGTNRLLMIDKISELYGEELAEEYIRQLEEHEIYKHDETSIYPYTYSGKEAVVVKIDGVSSIVALDELYDKCDCEEHLLDEAREVYGKYPSNIEIRDEDGSYTKIERLIKKKRHRDLVCVRVNGAENVIVTDNHPMIVSEDKNNTVPAIDSLGHKQKRINGNNLFSFDPITQIRLEHNENYKSYVANHSKASIQYSHANAILNKEFGYFVGFFIAEGYYIRSRGEEYDTISITQKDVCSLIMCADYLYRATGITSHVTEKENGMYVLRVTNHALINLLINEFNIKPYAQNKTIPKNIFEYPKVFAKGLICGLIDGDGTVDKNGRANIRLASRTCISQLSQVLMGLDVNCSMSYTDGTLYEGYKMIQESYPLFGVSFTLPYWAIMSKKYFEPLEKKERFKQEEWMTIGKIIPIVNKKFLKESEYIYDITTESHTFALNNLWVHNCVSITMYPFLFDGLRGLGGKSTAPTNLDSYCGSFINLVFAIASQFAGAVSTPEFLMYMDYFIRKDYGDDYISNWNTSVTTEFVKRHRTLKDVVYDKFQQVVFSINQPAAARGYQAVN